MGFFFRIKYDGLTFSMRNAYDGRNQKYVKKSENPFLPNPMGYIKLGKSKNCLAKRG